MHRVTLRSHGRAHGVDVISPSRQRLSLHGIRSEAAAGAPAPPARPAYHSQRSSRPPPKTARPRRLR
ncbi:MAG: hypothetical protein OXU61_01790 [Gammaproteobacteria bacterium]|nr:hypothetical protein [Gammaproteobacteria bacterium]